MRPVKVAAVSMECQFGQVDANAARIVDLLATCAAAGAGWAVFPELCLQGAHTDAARMAREAEPLDGPVLARLRAGCRAHAIAATVGMVLRVSPRVKYNAVVHIKADGELAGYAPKVQMGPGEWAYADSPTPEESWLPVDLGFAKVGAMICYDGQFPEGARTLALRGAEVIVCPFAAGRCDNSNRQTFGDNSQEVARIKSYLPARAYDNRLYVVRCNHAGAVVDAEGIAAIPAAEPPLLAGSTHMWSGFSMVVDPAGAVVAESAPALGSAESIAYAELRPAAVAEWRRTGGANVGANTLLTFRPETFDRRLTASPPGTVPRPSVAQPGGYGTKWAGGVPADPEAMTSEEWVAVEAELAAVEARAATLRAQLEAGAVVKATVSVSAEHAKI